MLGQLVARFNHEKSGKNWGIVVGEFAARVVVLTYQDKVKRSGQFSKFIK